MIQKRVTCVTICRLQELIDAAEAKLNVFPAKIKLCGVELQQPKRVAGDLLRDASGDQVDCMRTKAASYKRGERVYFLWMHEDR